MPGSTTNAIRGTETAPNPSITMEVTPEMLATLREMARDAGRPLDVILTRTIGLYRELLRVTAEGKHVGCATSPDVLDVEFTGIASDEGH